MKRLWNEIDMEIMSGICLFCAQHCYLKEWFKYPAVNQVVRVQTEDLTHDFQIMCFRNVSAADTLHLSPLSLTDSPWEA